ncbi:hypothetical protein KI387_036500, partial [Taxus chinensis]
NDSKGTSTLVWGGTKASLLGREEEEEEKEDHREKRKNKPNASTPIVDLEEGEEKYPTTFKVELEAELE